jgi:hypothetical protein
MPRREATPDEDELERGSAGGVGGSGGLCPMEGGDGASPPMDWEGLRVGLRSRNLWGPCDLD